ncbi:MAG: Holliday junction branch migration protein RuvA [Duncaniella sp.]|nr:Holliday junction branch migration protein RuvA [Duncaniella sp.]
MYEYIKGIITDNTPTYVAVEAAGMGYMVNISLNTFTALQNCKGEVKLLLHEVIREDTWTLYGFYTARERELFRHLIGVSGVGAATAILILSSLAPAELEATITAGDHNRLKGVKGIGAKTAQRIIVDLKDKIKPSDDALLIQLPMPGAGSEVYDEALAALTALGFPRPQSQKVLRRIFDAAPDIKVEAAIKQALGMM